jgi:UDP-glucose 4-epimerase
MNKKTLMITGASGFVGSNFIKEYSDDYNIIPVCLIENKPEDLNYEGIDCILHLAALVHQMKGAPEEKYFEINRDLTEKLAITAKESGVEHFVFYSTVKVYGYDGDLYNHNFILDEKSPCKPNDPYGQSKYEAEEILRKLEDDNFEVAHIRPPMIYGIGVKGNMINLIKLIKKLPILPFYYDENKRTIVSMINLLDATKQVIDKKEKGIYIPTDGEAVSIKEMVEGVGEGLNKKIILIKFPNFIYKLLCKVKPNIMVRLYGSLQFKGNNQPIENMKDGLREMIRGK